VISTPRMQEEILHVHDDQSADFGIYGYGIDFGASNCVYTESF
jgi:hypothetical protein